MAWQNGKKIIALWSKNQNRNVWTYVQGIGWRKLASDSDNVNINFTTLAAHAKSTNSNVNFLEDGKTIKEMYVW